MMAKQVAQKLLEARAIGRQAEDLDRSAIVIDNALRMDVVQVEPALSA